MARLFALLIVLAGGPLWAESPKKLLLVGQGPDGHPPSTHEYMDGLKVLEKVLEPVKGLDATTVKADGKWENGPELIDRSDGIVIFLAEGAKWSQLDEKRYAALNRAAKRGAGLVGLHWGIGCKEDKYIPGWLPLLGGCHGGADRKYQVLETELTPDPKSTLAAGLSPFRVKDEFYYRLKFVKSEPPVRPAMLAKIDGEDHPVAWTWERPDGGRSFGFSGLHVHDNWKRPEYRRLVGQGVLWALKLPVPAGGLAVED